MSLWKRRTITAALLALLVFASGCYSKATPGDNVVYGFAWWVKAGVTLGAIVSAPLGWLLYKSWQWAGFVLMGMAPVLLVIVAPGMFLDTIEVRPDGFRSSGGIWFAPSPKSIEFTDVASITIQVKHRADRLGDHDDYSFVCHLKNGESEKVPVGDLMQFAVRDIIDRAKKRGVRIEGEDLLDRIEKR